MIFYRKKEDSISKYDISYEINKMRELRDALIKNCSSKKHVIKKSTVIPNISVDNHTSEITDLKVRNTGKTASYSDTSEDKTVYEYDYIFVDYPYLVQLIDSLLEGDADSINEIMTYDIEYPNNYDELIEETKNEIKDAVDNDPDYALVAIGDLKALLEEKELNKDAQSTEAYYQTLLSLFNYKFIDSMPISQIIAYKNFFSSDKDRYDYSVKNEMVLKIN